MANNKYKILTIVYNLDIGGTQRAAQNFAIAYHLDGHDSRVLPIYEAGERKNELVNEGVHVYAHGDEIEASIKLINSWLPDIIHIHRWGNADTYLSNILKKIKIEKTKVIETNVFSFADNSPESQLIDVHLHLSEWCLWRWHLFLKKKSFGIVLPYLVIADKFYKEDQKKITSYKTKLNLPHDKFIFGRIGQKSLGKFHKEIYLSFDLLYKTNKNIHLLIVGLPSVLLPEIESLLSFKERAVTLIDIIVGDEELRLAYNVMDCFLHYSFIGESFGMVLAEAQLCEVPVISIATPKADNSQLEVLVHGESALIVKNKSFLFEVMKKTAEGSYSLDKFGAAGRQHILANFTPQVLIPKLNTLIGLLLNSQNREKEISENFSSNIGQVSINHLIHKGYGEYSLTDKIFFIIPRYYLWLVNHISSLKSKLTI